MQHDFLKQVESIIGTTAEEKGYNINGADAGEFVHQHFGTGHALGEIIYKAIRYHNKRNPEDLIKIAAWAALAYKWEVENVKQSTTAAVSHG